MAYSWIVKPSFLRLPKTLKNTVAVKAIYAAMTIALLSTLAMAQQSVPYHACAAEKDSTARLACFDHADSARHPTSAATSAAPAASRSANPDIGLDAR